MSDNRLPPLRLNSAMSTNSNDNDITGSNISLNSRERRRQKLKEQRQAEDSEENSARKTPTETNLTNPKKNRRGRALPHIDKSNTNLAYENDEKNKVSSS